MAAALVKVQAHIVILRIMVYRFKEFIPVIDASAFVHPQAAVTGCVVIGKDVYVGPFAAIRGDFGTIIIEDGCNVQESCTIHMFPGVTVHLEKMAHIGHGAIIHGALIGENSLIGMHAVIMDGAEIGAECIVGAMTFIKEGTKIPPRSMVVGNPARIIKEVTDEMIAWKTEGTKIYQQLARDCQHSLNTTEPLRHKPAHWPEASANYASWKKYMKMNK